MSSEQWATRLQLDAYRCFQQLGGWKRFDGRWKRVETWLHVGETAFTTPRGIVALFARFAGKTEPIVCEKFFRRIFYWNFGCENVLIVKKQKGKIHGVEIIITRLTVFAYGFVGKLSLQKYAKCAWYANTYEISKASILFINSLDVFCTIMCFLVVISLYQTNKSLLAILGV